MPTIDWSTRQLVPFLRQGRCRRFGRDSSHSARMMGLVCQAYWFRWQCCRVFVGVSFLEPARGSNCWVRLMFLLLLKQCETSAPLQWLLLLFPFGQTFKWDLFSILAHCLMKPLVNQSWFQGCSPHKSAVFQSRPFSLSVRLCFLSPRSPKAFFPGPWSKRERVSGRSSSIGIDWLGRDNR